jgi:AcrR family transcriptional regulator
MARGAETRQRIETETLRLCVERGVAETSIRDIAQAAHVAEGALYRHYPSKDALVGHLFTSNYARFAAELDRLQAGETTARAKLTAMIAGFCRFFDTDPVLFRFLLFVQHEHLRQVRGNGNANPVDVVRRAVAEAVQRDEIPRRDPSLLTAWVFGLVLQTATFAVYGRIASKLEPLADEIAGAVWRAISMPLPRARA